MRPVTTSPWQLLGLFFSYYSSSSGSGGVLVGLYSVSKNEKKKEKKEKEKKEKNKKKGGKKGIESEIR